MKSLITLLFLISFGAEAQRGQDFLRRYQIKLLPENMHPGYVQEFRYHLELFPEHLLQEMLRQGTKITLIEGRGVADDPTFHGGQRTFDGRRWAEVPGSGGSPRHHQPTRIVINRFEDTTSANLFLHEHAHTLNHLYRNNGVSQSRAWKDALEASPGHEEFLRRACGSYCFSNDDEMFAELFAIYFSGNRRVLERVAPGVAEFFRNLRSIRDVSGRRLWGRRSLPKLRRPGRE